MKRIIFILLVGVLQTKTSLNAQSFWIPTNAPETGYFALAKDDLGDIYAVGDSGTYRSTNNGLDWTYHNPMARVHSYLINSNGDHFAAQEFLQGLKRRLAQDSVWTTVLAMDILSIAVDLQGMLFAGSLNSGVFRSTNNGTTWSPAGLGEYEIAVITSDSLANIYAGHATGIHKSTNAGASWRRVASTPFSIGYIALADSGFLYAASDDSGTVLRSTDIGETWHDLNVNNLRARMVLLTSRGHVLTVKGGDHTGPIVCSTDRGVTWNEWTESTYPFFMKRMILASTDRLVLATYNHLFTSRVSIYSPWVTTSAASGVTQTGASLNGMVNPNGVQTWCAFQFGESVNYGTTTSFVNVGSGETTIPVTAVIGGLVSGRTYHFRLIAATALGDTVYGNDTSFTTVITIPPSPTAVSPAHGATLPGPAVRTIWMRTEPRSDRFWIELATDSLFVFRIVDTSVTDTSRLWSGLVNGQTYWWRVRGFNIAGYGPFSVPRRFTISTTGVAYQGTLPSEFALRQNHPNPFNPETEIRYDVPSRGHVTITIFNVLGKEVATLVDETQSPGSYIVRWIPDLNASGVYYYRMTAGEFSETKKMMLVK